MSSANLAAFLEAFFTDRLIAQRRVSPHTVASYRDTFRLLLQFAQKELGKSPSKLAIPDLNAALIGAFLDNLERNSGQRLSQPKCPPHSDPVLFSLHGAGVPRALGSNPARTRDPTKAAIQPVSGFSDEARD